MGKHLYLYPVWVRLWHLLNAISFLLLIISGLSMQYASVEYPAIRFDIAVSMHNFAGVALLFLYLIFVLSNIFTSNGRFYNIRLKGFPGRLRKQFHHYTFGMFRKEDPPFPVTRDRKFNPLQLIAYVSAMYVLLPLILVTGLALLFPETILMNVFGWSGIQLTALLHSAVGFVLSLFMIIHIYFCTMGKKPGSNFRSMINGYHE